MNTRDVLNIASANLDVTTTAAVFMDSGVENLNSDVDKAFEGSALQRIIAQIDVSFSNSLIEAWWRSLKHQWLYMNSLDSIERLRILVAFFVEQHNTQMPHSAFSGQTPDEMYFGTAADLPAELAAARSKAREERLAANRAMSCNQCIGQQPHRCCPRSHRRPHAAGALVNRPSHKGIQTISEATPAADHCAEYGRAPNGAWVAGQRNRIGPRRRCAFGVPGHEQPE